MTGFDIWDAIIGSGFLIGVLSFWLNWKSAKSRKSIDWYDRAISEIERLERRLTEVLDNLEDYKKRLDEAEEKIEEQEDEIKSKNKENETLTETIAELKEIIVSLRKELKNTQERMERKHGR